MANYNLGNVYEPLPIRENYSFNPEHVFEYTHVTDLNKGTYSVLSYLFLDTNNENKFLDLLHKMDSRYTNIYEKKPLLFLTVLYFINLNFNSTRKRDEFVKIMDKIIENSELTTVQQINSIISYFNYNLSPIEEKNIHYIGKIIAKEKIQTRELFLSSYNIIRSSKYNHDYNYVPSTLMSLLNKIYKKSELKTLKLKTLKFNKLCDKYGHITIKGDIISYYSLHKSMLNSSVDDHDQLIDTIKNFTINERLSNLINLTPKDIKQICEKLGLKSTNNKLNDCTLIARSIQ